MRKGSKHEEEIEKIKEVRLRKNLGGRKKGFKVSEETRKKLSEAHLNLSEEKRERIAYGSRHNRYNEEYAKKLSVTKQGEINPKAKLTEDKVRKIKELWRTGSYSAVVLGEMFHISRQSVTDIVKGRTWKHVEEDDESS